MENSHSPSESSLPEQVLADQRNSFQQGNPCSVETYFDRHPELSSDREMALDIICHEIILRKQAGEKPSVEEYVQRFPQFADDIKKQFEVESALDTDDLAMSMSVTVVPTDKDSEDEATNLLKPGERSDQLGTLGRYEVLEIIGKGGMGIVYKALDPTLQRSVALKVMTSDLAKDRDACERFLREARIAASLEHDNIVPIYDVGTNDETLFLAMPLLKGANLKTYWNDKKSLTAFEVFDIGCQIASGLAAAHEHGLIHRDIKPGNIWIESGRDLRVKILDFGLARSEKDPNLTESGLILGTPAYMAPEQADGSKIDHRCDLFSLGCVLYQISTGELPFQARDAVAMLVAVATHDPAEPHTINADIPLPLSDYIMRLLAKNPDDRPDSAHEVTDHLRELSESPNQATQNLPQTSSTSSSLSVRIPWFRKRAILTIGVAAVILLPILILLGSGAFQHGNNSIPPDRKPEEKDKTAKANEKAFHPLQLGDRAGQVWKKNSLNMAFCWCPPGHFSMGSPAEETGRSDDEGQVSVHLTRGFWMGQYEVTQDQWKRIMGTAPWKGNINVQEGPKFPVCWVSWTQSVTFCEKLTKLGHREGWLPKNWVVDLPTEAQWEYACRAGTSTPFSFGDNSSELGKYAWFTENSTKIGQVFGHVVGEKKGNPWNLYDMHGNVWEWCRDWYSEKRVGGTDPEVTKPSDGRVDRGGGFACVTEYCRSAQRFRIYPNATLFNLGFRVIIRSQ